MPDQQDFDMKVCPDNTQMNAAAKGLFDVWTDRRGRDPQRLLVGMGDNFAPDFFGRTFTGKPPAPAMVPYPDKDQYVWNGQAANGGAWIPEKDATKKIPKTIPADNVGCFVRAMGYTALAPGKQDSYFGPERLQELAWFLFNPGKGTAILAGNLSISTSVPEAKARLPLYEVEHELKEEQRKHEERPTYTILPLVSGDDPSPSIKFPDVVLPNYRKFAVDNAYFIRIDAGDRENPGDRTDKFLFKRVTSAAGVLVVKAAAPLAPTPPDNLYFVESALKVIDPKAHRKVQLRIDAMMVCENTTDDPKTTAACWDIPALDSETDEDFKTARITF